MASEGLLITFLLPKPLSYLFIYSHIQFYQSSRLLPKPTITPCQNRLSNYKYLNAVRNAWDAQPDDRRASATIEFCLVNDSRFYINEKTEDERSSDKE